MTAEATGSGRCAWAGGDPLYVAYHDDEWGRPVADDRRLFEKLCLEGFQSGLAWITILRKRKAFRDAFAGFDPVIVAGFDDDDVERLLGDAGIVRHRGKIRSAINNAARALEAIAEHGTLAHFLWGFEGEPHADHRRTTTPESIALAKALKHQGWTFVGPTTVHAFMQSVGMLNDHDPGCPLRAQCDTLRANFRRP